MTTKWPRSRREEVGRGLKDVESTGSAAAMLLGQRCACTGRPEEVRHRPQWRAVWSSWTSCGADDLCWNREQAICFVAQQVHVG